MQFLRDTEQERVKSITLNRQLEAIRHFEYVGRNNENTSVNRDMVTNDNVSWEKGTFLVIGDSTLNEIQELRMGRHFKVGAFPGAIICDIYHHAIPLLEKILLMC